MNSDEERELFEAHGWKYDYVGRRWTAPDGFEIPLDHLVEMTVGHGEAAEESLRRAVRFHGFPKSIP